MKKRGKKKKSAARPLGGSKMTLERVQQQEHAAIVRAVESPQFIGPQ